jgi:polyisoprenyl-phosphate glycosyltransferase
MKPLPDLLAVPEPDAPALSVVIPFYNERDVLPECIDRVCAALRAVELPAEMVLVDDGSNDGSAELALHHRVLGVTLRVLRLSRNFGKEAAMTAGLDCARGEATIVLDADLQDPPEEIPRMVKAWRDGADVVLMQRRSRAGDSIPKRLSAWAFYRLQRRLCPSPMPVDTGDFRLMSRAAVHALRQLRERNRYMKGLYAWVGMPTQA